MWYCHIPYPLGTDRNQWKHCLLATTVADGNEWLEVKVKDMPVKVGWLFQYCSLEKGILLYGERLSFHSHNLYLTLYVGMRPHSHHEHVRNPDTVLIHHHRGDGGSVSPHGSASYHGPLSPASPTRTSISCKPDTYQRLEWTRRPARLRYI